MPGSTCSFILAPAGVTEPCAHTATRTGSPIPTLRCLGGYSTPDGLGRIEADQSPPGPQDLRWFPTGGSHPMGAVAQGDGGVTQEFNASIMKKFQQSRWYRARPFISSGSALTLSPRAVSLRARTPATSGPRFMREMIHPPSRRDFDAIEIIRITRLGKWLLAPVKRGARGRTMARSIASADVPIY